MAAQQQKYYDFGTVRLPSGNAVYFVPATFPLDPVDAEASTVVLDEIFTPGFFWLSLTASMPHGILRSQAEDEVSNLKLRKALVQLVAESSRSHDVWVADSIAWRTDSLYIEPGFTVQTPSLHNSAVGPQLQQDIVNLAATFQQDAICEYKVVEGEDPHVELTVLSLVGNKIKRGSAQRQTVLSKPPIAAPIFPSCASLHVYSSKVDALRGLLQATQIDSLATLTPHIDRLTTLVSSSPTATATQSFSKFIVALEGLDGTGKSTLANLLCSDGAILTSTPGSWTETDGLRHAFDKCGLAFLRRSFYFITNYLLASHIESYDNLIVDRYYYSSIAYAVGSTVHNVNELPIVSSPIWAWPRDLLPRPNLVVLVQLDPEIRAQRVQQRSSSVPVTEEEARLAKNRRFEAAVSEAYLRCCIHNQDVIPFTVIDGNDTPANIWAKVQAKIAEIQSRKS